MKRIVVGIDGSAAASAAIRWSSSLALATGSELTAVHAWAPPYAEIRIEDVERSLAQEHREMEGWLEPATELGVTVHAEVVEGDPRQVVRDVADARAADLVVLGRTGRGGGPGLLHVGSVAEHLAHDIRRPFAVIPVDAHPSIDRILVGVDGSEAAAAAVDWVADVAPLAGAEVVAVTVDEPIAEWTPSWDERNWRRDAVRELEMWTKPIQAADVDLDLVPIEHMYAADGLLGASIGRASDLVVVGTRGAGGFTGLRFGGVAMKMLHRASLPIVLVPPAEAP